MPSPKPWPTSYVVSDDKLIGGQIRSLHDFVDQSGSAPQMKARIDVTPSTAIVRVDLEKDATGTDYTDDHADQKMRTLERDRESVPYVWRLGIFHHGAIGIA